MTYDCKINLSIYHGFQITHFMSQQFSISLIIGFVETDNRVIKENTSILSNLFLVSVDYLAELQEKHNP